MLAIAGFALAFLAILALTLRIRSFPGLALAILALAFLACPGLAVTVLAGPGLSFALLVFAGLACAGLPLMGFRQVLVRRVDLLHLPGDFVADARRARLVSVRMPDLHENEVTLPDLRDRRLAGHPENGVRILSVRGHDTPRIP